MVLLDTSIWIQLFRQKESSLGGQVSILVARNEAAICGQVLVEFIGGFRKPEMRREFGGPFEKFPFLDTPQKGCRLAAEILGNHPQLGSGDAVIAATALYHKVPLMTLDKGFRVLEDLYGLEIFKI